MIDIEKYRRIIPQTKIVNKIHKTQVKNLELPCFDHIYDCTDIDKDKYPYGVFITDSGAESILDCLYDTSPKLYNIYNSKAVDTRRGGCGDVAIPMFVIKDCKGNPINTNVFNRKKYFSEYVEKYSDMNDIFKIKQGGFFQPEQAKMNVMAVTSKIMKKHYTCSQVEMSQCNYSTKYKINGILRTFYIDFLTDENIEFLYDQNILYDYVEQYVFCYIDKRHDYMYENDIVEYIGDANAIVEPILIDEDDGTIPLLRYHAIFFPCRYYYKHFLGDITHERKRLIEIVSFYSSEADDPVNVFFKNTYNILIKGDIVFTTLIQSNNVKDAIKADYTITLNPLRNNTKFVERNVNHNLFTPVEIPIHIKSHGFLNMQSTDVYEVDPTYFNRLKLKSEKEVTHIKEITVNKYYLDLQAEDDCNIHLNDLIYSVYIDDEKHT